MSAVIAPVAIPAQFSIASRPPNSWTAACTAASRSASFVTSQCSGMTSPCVCAAVSFSAPLMSTATTFAPSRANTLTDALPMPEPAPVTTATFPSNSPIELSLPLLTGGVLSRQDDGTNSREGATLTTTAAVYWDPYDVELASDPYPTYQRLRAEAPLYVNDKHDFYAVSRFADCENGLKDWESFRSGRGAILEPIRAGIEIPPGTLIFEDPPIHDIHRSLLVRVFTPRRVAALEPKIREICVRALDAMEGADR